MDLNFEIMKYRNYLSNFSKKYLCVGFILVLFFSACDPEEILKEEPLDFLSPVTAYSTVGGLEQGMIGIYERVRNNWYRNGGSQAYGLYGLGTDACYDGEAPGAQRFMTNYITSVHSNYSVIVNWWRFIYAEIQYANNIIKAANDLDEELWRNAAQKNFYLAEAKFFRAHAHRMAVTLWGDVPLVTEVIDYAKVDFDRTPKAQVYSQIEEDLLFAAQYLPEPGSESHPGRVTQGAALHMLAKVYLAQEKFQLAVDAASSVIDDYGYALMTERFGEQRDVFGTGDVYWDLFRYDNQNAAENTETIWAIQFEPAIDKGGSSNYWSGIYGPRYFSLGNTPDGYSAFHTGYQDTLGRPVSRNRGTDLVNYHVWASDWDNDIRNAEHNIKRRFYFDNPESEYDGQLIDWDLYPPGSRNVSKDTINYIYPFFMKTWQPVVQSERSGVTAAGGGGSVHSEFYAMRLAETYLLRAEAYIGLGNNVLAAADINEVRNRANANPVSPGEVDIDYLLDERIRELYAEEMRLIVLMRMGMLVERTQKYHDNPYLPGANIQEHNRLFPIPQSQLDLNRDADFPQNPGYGS